MQAERFDLAVQLYGSGVYSNPFTLMLGARATAGFVRPGDPPGRLDAALPFPEVRREVERPLALTRFLGAPPCGDRVEFPLWPEDEAAAEELLAGADRPLIGVHPAGTEATKRWPAERFAAAASELARRLGGTVVLCAGPGERPLADAVAARVQGPCRNLAGRTSLPVAGAVLERLAIFLTNDSGPAHVAYALGVPSVTIFGGTDPVRWGPSEDARQHRTLAHPAPCRPCAGDRCPIGYACLAGVTVAEVVAAALDLLAGGPARAPLAPGGAGSDLAR
jgi:ADP-heptose:LPS heptosyltransferase